MTLHQKTDYTFLDALIFSNVRFALYRFAWQKEVHLMLQTAGSDGQLNTLKELNDETGFVIAPFRVSADAPVTVIRPDVVLTGEGPIFDYLHDYQPGKGTPRADSCGEASLNTFAHYRSAYDTFYSALTSGNLQKVVLSRTFDVARGAIFSAGAAFRRACKRYESAFVFLCNTPETGAWMGVSPELLVSEQGGVYKTVALAGTKKLSTEAWDGKNREEQQIVVDYMRQQLNRIGGEVVQSGPFTVQAGAIEHLKTKFSFCLKAGKQIGDLLDLLHPSPAVCGFPKEEAFDFILKNEPYNRRYYSGFVGPLHMDSSSRLYVNLRCMQIGRDVLRLYAGGGILLSSELKAEWEETENKLQTMLSVIDE